METTEKKWYQKPVWIYVLCFAFFPVGWYLLWKNQEITRKMKIIFTCLSLLFVIVMSKDSENGSSSTSTKGHYDPSKKILCDCLIAGGTTKRTSIYDCNYKYGGVNRGDEEKGPDYEDKDCCCQYGGGIEEMEFFDCVIENKGQVLPSNYCK